MTKPVSFIATALLAISAPLAQGASQIAYEVNGGGAVTCNTGPDSGTSCFAVPTAIGGGVTISNTSVSANPPGGPLDSFIQQSTTRIETGAAAATVTLWVVSQNFLFPTTPPDIRFISNVATTATLGSGTVNLTSCIDTGNDLIPPVSAFCSPGISLSNPALPFSVGSDNNEVSSIVSTLSPPFSLSQQITISLNAFSRVNVVTSASLTQVPEPASIALFGAALFITSQIWRRKRKAQM